MCGIVGYVGRQNPLPVIIAGLRRLEYRGYDSAGIALTVPGSEELFVCKTKGKISDLEKALAESAIPAGARAGIGHTRWATHGEPSRKNAHPHLSHDGRIAVVHNGIIENHSDLRRNLSQRGFVFSSETDSEVIAHLIQACYEGDLKAAVAAAVRNLQGAYGIAVVSSMHPDLIVVARQGSPIVIGIGDGETIVASDAGAVVQHTRQAIFLDDGDMACVTGSNVEIASISNVPVTRELTHIDWDAGRLEKGGYDHFMLKEIHEQPRALADTIRGRVLIEEGTAKLSGLRLEPADIARVRRALIAACGTSLYAGMTGKYLFEDIAGIPADAQQAAELRYRNPIIEPDTIMLAISQSGETADTLAAVREGVRKGAMVFGICNVVGSSIARAAGRGVYLHAGPEIGVASTKAFSSQVAVLAMMALLFGRTRRLSAAEGSEIAAQIAGLPRLAEETLAREDAIRKAAEKHAGARDFFFIGRGYLYPAALEGALKLKEISYIHAEGYHAAELKHGPIALLDRNVPVFAAAPHSSGRVKTLANMQECRARGAPVIAVATDGDDSVADAADDIIRIPPCPEYLSPIPVVIVEQLFAYYAAKARGCPIDQPRNLAKSVTVE